MKNVLTPIRFIAVLALLAVAVGCATTKHTEQLLSEAGFKRVAASSDQQTQHLKSLPVDKLSVTKLNGKTFYVFPDPAHNQIYVGNTDQYQNYQQILMYNKINGDNRVMASLGEDTGGGNDGEWVLWTSSTGWTNGVIEP